MNKRLQNITRLTAKKNGALRLAIQFPVLTILTTVVVSKASNKSVI